MFAEYAGCIRSISFRHEKYRFTGIHCRCRRDRQRLVFQKGKYLDAQQACFDLSNQVPSYEYWVAKGFIILADTYSKLGNDFQAKSTLQSIIEEYSVEDDGIIVLAQKKLDEISQPK